MLGLVAYKIQNNIQGAGCPLKFVHRRAANLQKSVPLFYQTSKSVLNIPIDQRHTFLYQPQYAIIKSRQMSQNFVQLILAFPFSKFTKTKNYNRSQCYLLVCGCFICATITLNIRLNSSSLPFIFLFETLKWDENNIVDLYNGAVVEGGGVQTSPRNRLSAPSPASYSQGRSKGPPQDFICSILTATAFSYLI